MASFPTIPDSRWLIYQGAVTFTSGFDHATIIDRLFESNGWSRSWRDTVYDFVHYHSQVHEVMGVAMVTANRVRWEQGASSRRETWRRNILSAGSGHRLIEFSRNFLVVGAYPERCTYDKCTDSRERLNAVKRVARVAKPAKDLVYGQNGPLMQRWRSRGTNRR
jgi:uncharacterized protein YjlB